jgi:SLT domain-containing protein
MFAALSSNKGGAYHALAEMPYHGNTANGTNTAAKNSPAKYNGTLISDWHWYTIAEARTRAVFTAPPVQGPAAVPAA